ncbi:DedA family protein [Shewanella marina]|uniref:DedA family protein n=1 Tax=Shewanella marina TaxID=487319 RepID=UPI00046FE3F8|nr:DedA family protein [Shewanella marina]
MIETLNHIVAQLTPWLEQYGYFVLIAAIAVEGFGIPAPGQSLLIVASILAASGSMSLPLVLTVGFASAFIGNSIGYFIGLKFGDVLLKKQWIKPATEQRLTGFIDKYGLVALILSRFIEGLKQFMFIGCGIAKMPLKMFVLGNFLATSLWVILFGLGPVLLKHELTPMLNFYHHHQITSWLIALATIIILASISVFIKSRKQ